MPQVVDEEKMKGLQTMDPNKPPTKEIEHAEFPRVVYKHPTEKFHMQKQKTDLGEIVMAKVATEHTYITVQNKTELEKAIKSGYQLKPYIPADPDAAE